MSAKKEPCVEGESLEILKELQREGYVYTGKNRKKLRFLQRLFPVFKRAQFKNKSIFYMEDKNKFALLEMMKQDKSRIISYQELSRMTHIFNTDIEKPEKRSFLGKNKAKKMQKIKESASRYGSTPKEKQSLLDDFLGRFLHSEVLLGFCIDKGCQICGVKTVVFIDMYNKFCFRHPDW
jgi:hypothetical protein